MSRSLGVLTLDLIARTGGFESGMDKAKRIADRKSREIEREMKARAKAIDDAFAKMAKGIAAAFTAVQIVSLVKGTADLADQLSKLSQRTGVAVSELSALSYAAKLNDATLDDLGKGLKGLSNKMLAAQAGSAEAASAFKALGINVTDSKGKLRPAEQVLLDIADAFSKMEDGAGKSALANKLMEESGIRLIPTLNNGRAGLAAMRSEAEALGAVIGDDLAQASVALNDNLARLQTLSQGVAIEIGNSVVPSLNQLATEFLNARKAGLSFWEAVFGIGLSDPTKGPAQHIASITAELDKLQKAQQKPWWTRSYSEHVGAEQKIAMAKKELEYWRLQLLGTDVADPRDHKAAPKKTSPATAPGTPSKGPQFEPLATAAQAYSHALEALNKIQLSAETSGWNLSRAQQQLFDVMTSAEWLRMPDSWKQAIVAQGELAIAAEKAANEFNPLTSAAEAYGRVMGSLTGIQRDAETSGLNLTRAQAELLDLINSPAWAAMPDSWREAVVAQAEYAINAEKAAADQERLNELLAATPTAQLEKQRETMQFLAAALESGRINAEQYAEAVQVALGRVPDKAKDAADGFLDLTLVANDAARAMASGFTNFLFDPVNKSIKSMLLGFLKATAQMIVQAQMLKAIQAGMSAMGIPLANAKGNAFDQSGIVPFARGGVVDRPTFFKFASGGSFRNGVMGEAGPEAIMPLKRGPDGKLGVTANGRSGDVNVAITINEGTRNEQAGGDRQQAARELARQIESVTLEVIARNKRPGGLLYQ